MQIVIKLNKPDKILTLQFLAFTMICMHRTCRDHDHESKIWREIAIGANK